MFLEQRDLGLQQVRFVGNSVASTLRYDLSCLKTLCNLIFHNNDPLGSHTVIKLAVESAPQAIVNSNNGRRCSLTHTATQKSTPPHLNISLSRCCFRNGSGSFKTDFVRQRTEICREKSDNEFHEQQDC